MILGRLKTAGSDYLVVGNVALVPEGGIVRPVPLSQFNKDEIEGLWVVTPMLDRGERARWEGVKKELQDAWWPSGWKWLRIVCRLRPLWSRSPKGLRKHVFREIGISEKRLDKRSFKVLSPDGKISGFLQN